MNSSSLSRAGACLALAAGLSLINALLLVVVDAYAPYGAVVALLVLAGIAAGAHFLRRLNQVLGRAARICTAAAQGDLEARTLELPEPGTVGTIQRAIDNMLDTADAFVRETSGSTHALSE